MWCLVVSQHDLNDQCLPHGKEKLLCLKRGSCLRYGITGNEYYDANELQLPLLLYPVKALSQVTMT